MRLGVGTAQFGADYGVTNRAGQVSADEAARILRRAAELGIDLLDTAAAYGESESILGRLLWPGHPFRVVTKLAPLHGARDGLMDACTQSLMRLGRASVYALLLHEPRDLAPPHGTAVAAALERIKREGRARKIGVSVYTGADIDQVLDVLMPDVIQLPINALSQGLADSGYLSRLRDAGVEIHARSVFLQGVLLTAPERLPPYFMRFAKELRRFHELARELRVTPLRLALGYVAGLEAVDTCIVGATSVGELEQIFEEAGRPLVRGADWATLACRDDALTNAARWPSELR